MGSVGFGWGRSNAWYGLVRALFGFPTGILLFRLWDARRLPRLNVPWLLPMLAMVALAPAITLATHVLPLWLLEPAVVLLVLPPLVWITA